MLREWLAAGCGRSRRAFFTENGILRIAGSDSLPAITSLNTAVKLEHDPVIIEHYVEKTSDSVGLPVRTRWTYQREWHQAYTGNSWLEGSLG